MTNEDVRYWPRVGMYVTMEFAEEWIERMSGSGDNRGGRYLDSEIEEFQNTDVHSPVTLRREITNLFEMPFEQAELPEDIQAIVTVHELERTKVPRIKELKAEGYSLEDAKAIVEKEINEAVANVLGVEIEEDEEGAEIGKDSEAPEDDETE